jgi:hypothetical protein
MFQTFPKENPKVRLILAATFGACLAHGSIILSLDGPPSSIFSGPDTGDYIYTYTASLTGDERLDPDATSGVSCTGVSGTIIQCNPPGTFFTIYDVGGLVGVASMPVNWISSVQLIGLSPALLCGSCIDDPTVPNVTFSYTGPVIQANGIDTPFDGFQIISSVGVPDASGTFSSQSTLNVGASSGETDQVFGPVTTPAPGSVSVQDTPEPSTLFLMGAGLLCVGRFRRSSR